MELTTTYPQRPRHIRSIASVNRPVNQPCFVTLDAVPAENSAGAALYTDLTPPQARELALALLANAIACEDAEASR